MGEKTIIIEINTDPTPLTEEGISDFLIQGKTGTILPKIVEEVKRRIELITFFPPGSQCRPAEIGRGFPKEIRMNLKGSQTEKNLEKAFAAESTARNAYTCYAEAARKGNHPLVADVFLEIAKNEEEHARAHLGFLQRIQDTQSNLETAVQGEHYEATTIYPGFAKTAREEGFESIADYFERMTHIEARHEKIIRNLLDQLKEGRARRTDGRSFLGNPGRSNVAASGQPCGQCSWGGDYENNGFRRRGSCRTPCPFQCSDRESGRIEFSAAGAYRRIGFHSGHTNFC